MNTGFFILSALTAVLISTPLSAAEQAQQAGHAIALKPFAEGFTAPTAVAALPSGGNLLVADQAGMIHVVSKDGQRAEKFYLDVRPRLAKLNPGFDERGLLGLALHPKFAENKKFFVVYSVPLRANAPAEWDHTMRLSQFTATADGASAKPDSEKVILEIDKPYFNHNGGTILFGPDNYLYFAVGDGGNANDQDERNKSKGRPPEGYGQNLQTLLGKILRIDIDKGEPYSVPQDNPFVGKDARPEIFAYGLRNPWRISFDRAGQRELFAADVGQEAFEEVNIIKKGGNYGWRIKEGLHCFNLADTRKALADCPNKGANGDPLIDPIFEYKNLKAFPRAADAQGTSITGGYVYRGQALPAWQGKYIFADWSRTWIKPEGVLFAATKAGDGKWTWEKITPASHAKGLGVYVTGFAEDNDGELYLLTNDSNAVSGNTGKLLKIIPAQK